MTHRTDGALGVRWLQAERGEWPRLLASAGYFALVLLGYFLLRPVREAMGVARSMDDLRWLFAATCIASLGAALAFGAVVSRLDRVRFITVGHVAIAVCVLAFAAVRPLVGDDARIVLGGTLGALAGSTFAARMAESIGASWQLALAAGCFLLTTPLVAAIDHRDRAPPRRVGGNWIEGLSQLVRSPYLLGAALYVVLMTVSSTLLYFTRAQVVVDASAELEARISAFGRMDAWTQGATLFVQLFVTGQLIRRLGVGITLAILPAVTVGGFALLAWLERRPGIEAWQIFGAVTAFSAVHGATRFAVARPTRETLFNVVSRGEKYKAKPVIDLFVYRGGDLAGAWATSLVSGLFGVFMLALPLGAVWAGMSIALAAAQRRRAEAPERERSRPSTGEAAAAAEGVVA